MPGVIATGLFDRNIGESLVETAAGIPQPVPGDSESNTDWATVASYAAQSQKQVRCSFHEDNMDGD